MSGPYRQVWLYMVLSYFNKILWCQKKLSRVNYLFQFTFYRNLLIYIHSIWKHNTYISLFCVWSFDLCFSMYSVTNSVFTAELLYSINTAAVHILGFPKRGLRRGDEWCLSSLSLDSLWVRYKSCILHSLSELYIWWCLCVFII